jgi:hypothetical protein
MLGSSILPARSITGRRKLKRPMTVWVYVDTRKQVGDREHLKVFASEDAAETWFEENDPEGVAFEYEVLNRIGRRTIMCMMLIAALAIIWNSLGH